MKKSRSRRRRVRRRLVLGAVLGAVLLAVAWTLSQLWLAGRDLRAARDAASDLGQALEARDGPASRHAAGVLRTSAAAAAARTDGWWLAGLEIAPVFGDDIHGLRALSASLDLLAADGVGPLADATLDADHLTVDGRVDIALARRVQPQVATADDAVSRSAAAIDDVDPDDLSSLWRADFEEYAGLVARLDDALGSARTALELLPGMVGADGPRDYLLVFQNNAEIRSGGGVPGSWAHVHAEDGVLTMREQGSAAQFGERVAGPVLPLTSAERHVYGNQLGTYFQDATFTPDFPRAADLMAARWEEEHPAVRLDGVVSVDTVSLGYALEGIGSVPVGEATLTADNAVDLLLRDVYAALPPGEQDDAFQQAARAVFDASQAKLASEADFLSGIYRAVQEDRIRLVSFRRDEAAVLDGSRIVGAAPQDDGLTPLVGVTLDDATGSKMSYYLRHDVSVETTDCTDGVQAVTGRAVLRQAIAPTEAGALPDYVTGGGRYGITPGTQLVLMRLFAPYGGRVEWLEVDGRRIGKPDVVDLAGRPVLSVPVQLGEREIEVRWLFRSGPGQTGDPEVTVTPGVEPGSRSSTVDSAC